MNYLKFKLLFFNLFFNRLWETFKKAISLYTCFFTASLGLILVRGGSRQLSQLVSSQQSAGSSQESAVSSQGWHRWTPRPDNSMDTKCRHIVVSRPTPAPSCSSRLDVAALRCCVVWWHLVWHRFVSSSFIKWPTGPPLGDASAKWQAKPRIDQRKSNSSCGSCFSVSYTRPHTHTHTHSTPRTARTHTGHGRRTKDCMHTQLARTSATARR